MADGNRPKKVISEHRKQQNRRAQKTYRERQSRRLRTLEALLESSDVPVTGPAAFTEPSSSLYNSFADQQAADVPQGLQLPYQHLLPRDSHIDDGLSNAGLSHHLASSAALSSTNRSSSSDTLSLLTSASSTSSSKELLHRLLQKNDRVDDATRRSISSGAVTVEDILQAGLDAFSKGAGSETCSSESTASDRASPQPLAKFTRGPFRGKTPWLRTDQILVIENRLQEHASRLPDLQMNCIRIKQLCSVTAVRHNADILGITFEQLCDEDSQSPFHDSSMEHDAQVAACATRFKHVSPDLRPTDEQLRRSHHPWIDTMPSPTLRRRVIQCLSAEPPLMDEDEFCGDLQNGGLVCWGSTLGSANRPSGSGAPWDVRSWEAQPWFLRKWWFVLGGSSGELYHSSKWWTEMRGDSLRNYPCR